MSSVKQGCDGSGLATCFHEVLLAAVNNGHFAHSVECSGCMCDFTNPTLHTRGDCGLMLNVT